MSLEEGEARIGRDPGYGAAADLRKCIQLPTAME